MFIKTSMQTRSKSQNQFRRLHYPLRGVGFKIGRKIQPSSPEKETENDINTKVITNLPQILDGK